MSQSEAGRPRVRCRGQSRVAVLHWRCASMSLPGVIAGLRKIAGRDAVLDRPEDLMLYEYDAGIRKSTPGAVVFPQNTQHVSEIMRWPLRPAFRSWRAALARA